MTDFTTTSGNQTKVKTEIGESVVSDQPKPETLKEKVKLNPLQVIELCMANNNHYGLALIINYFLEKELIISAQIAKYIDRNCF